MDITYSLEHCRRYLLIFWSDITILVKLYKIILNTLQIIMYDPQSPPCWLKLDWSDP